VRVVSRQHCSLAPQIEHPKNVHLLRGNHEAADINALFGFRMECVERLGAPDIARCDCRGTYSPL